MTARSGAIAASLIAAALALTACGRSSPDSRTGPDTAPTGQDTVSSTGSDGAGTADSSNAQQGASSAATPPASGNQPNSQ